MAKFDKKNKEIATKWGTSPHIVAYIRSIHHNLHYDRGAIMDRQKEAIKNFRYTLAKATESSNQRKKWAKEEPEKAEYHLAKAAAIDKEIAIIKTSTRRQDILSFLEKMTDSDFQKLVL